MFSNLHYVLYTSLLVSESDEFVLKHHSSEFSRSSGKQLVIQSKNKHMKQI